MANLARGYLHTRAYHTFTGGVIGSTVDAPYAWTETHLNGVGLLADTRHELLQRERWNQFHQVVNGVAGIAPLASATSTRYDDYGRADQVVDSAGRATNIAIDSRHRHIYIRTLRDGSSSNAMGKVARFQLDKPGYPPANFGDTGTNRLTPSFQHEWCFTGNGDKGFAIAPNGNVAVVGDPKDGLRLFHGSEAKVPWDATKLANLPHAAGGVRFDLAGNLYVGYIDRKPAKVPAGFESDPFAAMVGRIHKYSPTGTLESGNLFPTTPSAPARNYEVLYGAFDVDCIVRTPRFAVDGFGRIYYPTNIAQRVSVIDNSGKRHPEFWNLRQPRLDGRPRGRPRADEGHSHGISQQRRGDGRSHLRGRHGEPSTVADREAVRVGNVVSVARLDMGSTAFPKWPPCG